MSAVVTLKKGVSFPVNANVVGIVVDGDPENYSVRDTVKGFDLMRTVNDRKIIAGMIELPDDSKESPLVFRANDSSLIAKGEVVGNNLIARYIPQQFVVRENSVANEDTTHVYSEQVTVTDCAQTSKLKSG